MVYVALAEAVCIVALAVALGLTVRLFVGASEHQQEAFREERADLLNAARNPHMLVAPRHDPPPSEPDEEEVEHARNLAVIGRVQ